MDMEPLPRRRTWPWVLLAVVAVLLCAGLVGYGFGRWL
jgi:high-affinity Fe2+/Pb2+ permease